MSNFYCQFIFTITCTWQDKHNIMVINHRYMAHRFTRYIDLYTSLCTCDVMYIYITYSYNKVTNGFATLAESITYKTLKLDTI